MNTSPLGVGKGTLYLIGVQIVFLASGYIIHAGLGRLLGPASYGIFGVVIYLITLSQDFLRTGIPQAASKYIAEDNSKAGAIKNNTVKLQLIFSLLVFLVYLLLADIFADLLGDPSLTTYIRVSAFIIPAGAFFALYTNFLNGLRWYDKQAIVMLSYSIATIAGVFALVFFGYGIYGAIFGYLMGPLVGFALGWYFFKFESPFLEKSETSIDVLREAGRETIEVISGAKPKVEKEKAEVMPEKVEVETTPEGKTYIDEFGKTIVKEKDGLKYAENSTAFATTNDKKIVTKDEYLIFCFSNLNTFINN